MFKELIDNYTLDEIVEMFPAMKKSDVKKILKEEGAEIKYLYRTPISKALIPMDSQLNKYFKNNKRAKEYNELQEACNDNWIETETKTRTEIKKEHEQQLGCLLAEMSVLNQSINKQLKHIAYQKFIIDVINKLGNEDYIGIIAEEQYGKYDVPEQFTEDLLTDEMVVSFIGTRYGIEKATTVAQILRKG